ncbi:MAG TPA: hypothetical protein VF395_22800 [Polyangiaceae bacterium]
MNRVVCIVGMHRSGTSSLAGSLEEAGLHLGEVITSAPHNFKGNRENRRIMDLQEAVLVHSGGSWDRPPERATWSDEHRASRDAIIHSYEHTPVWGFKDPRTLLLLDFWREALSTLTFVGTFRHPLLVAESLSRRNGGSTEQWLDLWAAYTERQLALHDSGPFPIVRFDAGEDVYRRSLAVMMETLGLRAPARLGFFDPVLKHHVEPEPRALPERIQRLYDRLCRIAISP